MPFKSEKQRKYLWSNEPEVAKRFEKDAKREALKDMVKEPKKGKKDGNG